MDEQFEPEDDQVTAANVDGGEEESTFSSPAEQTNNPETQADRIALLNQVFGDIAEQGVFPVRLIQGGDIIDLIDTENAGATPDRPFVVLEVASSDPNMRALIYKTRIRPDPRNSAANEINFLQAVAPQVGSSMPETLQKLIKIPQLVAADANRPRPFVMQEKLEGRIAGSVHELDHDTLSPTDLEVIADFIKVLNSTDVNSLSPDLHIGVPEWRDYTFQLKGNEALARQYFGEDGLKQLSELLPQSDALLANQPLLFVAGDINPSNIIKMADSSLGMIDWERISLDRNPAMDYTFLLTLLHDQPEQQQQFLDVACHLNTDTPNFKEFMRFEFIYFRGIGELGYWDEQYRTTTDQTLQAKYMGHIEQLTQQIQDAIMGRGMWSKAADNTPVV